MNESIATWRAINNSSLSELIRNLAILIHDEPCVKFAIRILTSHCLGGSGIQLRYGNVPPTPNFKKHIDNYFTSFCQDAIVSYLSVGFVPYRIRLNEKGAKVPEVLPLGTFTWHVGRGNQSKAATPWESIGKPPPSGQEEKSGNIDTNPILRYMVQSAYCDETIHVYDFVKPQILFSCTSPLSALIQPYLLLCHRRECMLKAEAFNCQPSLVFEQQEKVLINDISNTGLAIQTPKDIDGKNNFEHRNIGERQIMLQQLIEESKTLAHMPKESIAIVAPKNHSVHAIEKAVSPQDIQKDEMQFCKMVAMACGLPVSMLMQGGESGNASSRENWAENTEGSNRMLLDTCRGINFHLESLLTRVHAQIYGTDSNPSFKIHTLPVIPFEHMFQAHDAQLLDDSHFSLILNSTWGFPLSQNAVSARAEKRKAEYVLPYRDKEKDKKIKTETK